MNPNHVNIQWKGGETPEFDPSLHGADPAARLDRPASRALCWFLFGRAGCRCLRVSPCLVTDRAVSTLHFVWILFTSRRRSNDAAFDPPVPF